MQRNLTNEKLSFGWTSWTDDVSEDFQGACLTWGLVLH